MGRLFAKLLQESQPLANPAKVANVGVLQGADSQIRKIRSQQEPPVEDAARNGFADSRARPVDHAARLLSAIRDAGLPDELLARDQSTPGELNEMDEEGLRAYVTSLGWSADIDAGRVPTGWDRRGDCEGCGPIFIAPGHSEQCIACPWCARRKAGKPIPRPRVNCRSCRYFIRDTINPAAAGGDCAAGVEYLSGAGPWPNVERRCALHRPTEVSDADA